MNAPLLSHSDVYAAVSQKIRFSKNILACLKRLGRPVFTTREAALLAGKSSSAATQALSHLSQQGLVVKACHGVWADAHDPRMSAYSLIPFVVPVHRAYLSFVSALHVHGIIEQIPQVITVASTSHTREVSTKFGHFSIHQISPGFFTGFEWYKGEDSFLIAAPEKALVDSLYLSVRKGRRFGHFPELHFPSSFSFTKARQCIRKITDERVRASVSRKMDAMALSACPRRRESR